ncbi:MAG TPA: type VI secretion system contractile sheath small subunit [Polyangiaceae bacterium]|jgi:type VI secretion system protein ImpB|nr:type VI secretion system contractile sheath small subunit [Polyangiaceae bacterium]
MAITDDIPKSRITLTYRTNVQGQPEDVTLPFRVLVMGDLSKGSSKDRALELDKRQIRRLDGKNLNHVMRDMGMSVRFSVTNRINPKTAGEQFDVTLPVTSTKSFLPAQVAQEVPRVKALLLLKKLLLEAQANFDNSKAFRGLLREASQTDGAIDKLLAELPKFQPYKLPAAMLTLEVPPDIAALPGLEIRRDDQPVPQKQWNQAVRVKPGQHNVRVFAPGKQQWTGQITAEHDSEVTLKIGPLVADDGKAK